LRLLQRSYFALYKIGWLKSNPDYAWHYYAKNLIRKGDVILDIGANLGYYSILFARWTGKTGRVYSVEPIALYNLIFNEKARRYPWITLYPYALGLEEKTIQMVAPEVSTGLPRVYEPGKGDRLEDFAVSYPAEMKIPSVLFGDLPRIDYIKCDIEGFEFTVLSNMKEIIRRCRPKVQVEVWGENEASLLAMFAELGYSPYKLKDKQLILQDGTTPAIGGDYLFVPKEDDLQKK
jgi:FkbM family methyltransferase